MAGVHRAHILVVDDDTGVRQQITDLLASAGYEVTAVASGTEALGAVTRGTPDLVLLEASLPDFTGFEVCRRLHAEGPAAPPVIFVTGRDSTADRIAGLDLGAVDYVVKPFEPQELAARVRAALRQKAARDALAAAAATDGLTGLLSRRGLDGQTAELMALSRRYSRPLSCVMLDVDHFKQINDTYGHAGGDEVLRQVAGRIRAASRASDVVGRYGGEEFTLLLPETDLPGAAAAAEKLRRLIAGEPIDVPVPPGTAGSESGSIAISVRISAGAATRTPEMIDPRALYAAADGALYRAKRSGRDQVAVAEQ